jgi:RNA polymerase sigma-70 factor, ECF subfamily
LHRHNEKENILPSDPDLIVRAVSGDRRAFEMLFHRYEKRVIGLAYRLTGDADLAADVTQEVFLRVYRSLSSFQLGRKFFTWLYKITVNASIDLMKKSGKARETPLKTEDIEALHVADPTPDGQDGTMEVVWSLVQQLSSPQRTAFILRETEDLSCGEIAAVMGCSAGTVRSHLSHARTRLRNAIMAHYPELKDGNTS